MITSLNVFTLLVFSSLFRMFNSFIIHLKENEPFLRFSNHFAKHNSDASSWDYPISLSLAVLAHGSCPSGFDLVRNGQCRGLYGTYTLVSFSDTTKNANQHCSEIDGLPVIIHDEEVHFIVNSKSKQLSWGSSLLGHAEKYSCKWRQQRDGYRWDFFLKSEFWEVKPELF